jgi:hypothetical protein
MPLGGERQRLIRRVVGVRGRLRFRLDLEPRCDYGRLRPTVEQAAERVVFGAPGRALAFAVPGAISLEPTPAGVSAGFDHEAGESRTFALESGECATPVGEQEAESLMHGLDSLARLGGGARVRWGVLVGGDQPVQPHA